MLEVIATTLEDAVVAERCGADRIELIAAFTEGGLTPSIGMVAAVLETVRIPVRVMIRPHSRGFVYTSDDVRVMSSDIRHVRAVGATELVLGLLRHDATVDRAGLEELLGAADGMRVTFHRAFDEANDQFAAMELLSHYPQITDVLTSGGQPTAPQGSERLQELHARFAGRGPSILAGSGLGAANIEAFMRTTGIRRLHVGSSVRIGSDPLAAIDPARLTAVREIVGKAEG